MCSLTDGTRGEIGLEVRRCPGRARRERFPVSKRLSGPRTATQRTGDYGHEYRHDGEQRHPRCPHGPREARQRPVRRSVAVRYGDADGRFPWDEPFDHRRNTDPDRKSVVEGKDVSVRVDLGGCRVIKKKKKMIQTTNKDQEQKEKKA